MSENPLDLVVEDAVNDSLSPETAPEASESTSNTLFGDAPVEAAADPLADDSAEPIDPLADPIQDDFEKKWGIPSKSVTGRENRLPHSRVKTMVTKAEQESYARGLKEAEGKHAPKLQEYETKIKDYDERWQRVAAFENVMENDPKTFLTELSKIPAYKEFFDHIGRLAAGSASPAGPVEPTLDHSDMPQPDQTLSDGSKVYSLDGLALRDEWLARKIEERAVTQAEARMAKRYQPIEQEWQQQQRLAQIAPQVERQIADARTWPNFSELEPEVVKILRSDPSISLDRAYVRAYQEQVIPKVSVDRNKMRTELLAELKQKPVSSSAPSGQARPSPQQAGPRSIEQIILDELKAAGLSGT